MTTILDLTKTEMDAYRATVRRRQEQEEQELAHTEKRAWQLARQAADVLCEQFGASRVVVFGSLIHTGGFTPWSDVDLAAWGLRPEDTFRAIGTVTDIDNEYDSASNAPAGNIRRNSQNRR